MGENKRAGTFTVDHTLAPETLIPFRSGEPFPYKAAAGDSQAVEVRIEGLPPQPSGDRPAAGSGPEQLVVTAVSPGTVTIELAQRRAWEKDNPRSRNKLRQ